MSTEEKSVQREPNSERIAELLHSAAIRLLRTARRVDDKSGTTASRLSALSAIVFGGPITLSKLAEAEQVRPPTMTRIVNALEEQQLVVKRKDTSDGRTVLIAATTKGKRLLLRGRARRVAFLAEHIRQLYTEEQMGLSAALSTIERLIERAG